MYHRTNNQNNLSVRYETPIIGELEFQLIHD
jgi:hypothetical protein